MKKNFKKILTAALITTASATMIGCTSANNKLAKNIDKGMAEFVSSINNLDYVDTSSEKLGKIVETAAITNTLDDSYLTKTLEELGADNEITLPNSRSDNFNLFVLTDKPFITLTSSDDNLNLNMQLTFSTNKIEDASEEINTKINNLILKRSILLIYVNEIYNNRVNLSEENRVAINAYVNVIKENASYLSGNRGMVKNQLTLANDLKNSKSNDNLVNYYMIKSGEALETRASKIDATISAIDSITKIIENNLDQSSVYYNSSLSNIYQDIIDNIQNKNSEVSTENLELAQNICKSLDICQDYNETEIQNNLSNQTNNNQITTLSNKTKNITNKTINNTNSTPQSNTNTINNRKFNQTNSQRQNSNLNKNQNINRNSNNLSKNNKQANNANQNLTDDNYYTTQNPTQKNANSRQFNRNLTQNKQNNNNFNRFNQFHDQPTTLDLPRNEYQISNSNKTKIENNNTQKQEDNSYKNNTNNLSINQTRKKINSNPEIKNGYENIKRVPYRKTLD